jgi:hypothetical protein
MTDRFEDVNIMLPPEFRDNIDFAVARRSTDQTSVRRQCVPGGDGRDCDIDALFVFMRIQNGVEHVGDARQTLLAFVRLIGKRILDALLGPVVRVPDQPFKQQERRIDKAGLDIA